MRIFAAVVLMASVSTPALAQASHDTLSEAVDSAISNNPTLMAERKTRGVADEVLNQASAQMGPQLSLSGSYGITNTTVGRQVTTPSGSFPDDGDSQRGQVGLEARQSLWSGGALTAQRDQARAGVDESQARLLTAEQDTVLSVVTAFVDVRRSERELEIRETNVASLREQVRAATDRFDVGEVTRTDVSQAQAQAAASEAELAKSKANLARARAIYEQIVGRPPCSWPSRRLRRSFPARWMKRSRPPAMAARSFWPRARKRRKASVALISRAGRCRRGSISSAMPA